MKAASRTISEECSVVALYGIEPSATAAESFYHTMVQWFNDLDCPPDKVGVTGPGHSRKVVSFPRGNAKLLKAGFEGVTDIQLIATIPCAQIVGHDYYLTATYNGRAERWYAFLVARSSLATLSSTSMLPLARTLAQELKPAYGIGYRMEHRLGPEWDVVGGGYGGEILKGEAYEEACNKARWGDMGMPMQVYLEGLVRDVYPWNFLTRPQLSRRIGDVPLERWIKQDALRGTLNPLCEGVFLWEVDEASIPAIRRALREADVIFDWRRYSNHQTLPKAAARANMPGMLLTVDERPRGDFREVAVEPDPTLTASTVRGIDWSDIAFVELVAKAGHSMSCSGSWEHGFAAVYYENDEAHVSARPLESPEEMVPLLQSYGAGDDRWRHLIGWT